MKINEVFYSIQGEGIFIGLPMVFIRVTGCNLRCSWCDTKYAYDNGNEITNLDLINELKQYPSKNVCITGGEPMAQNEILLLINDLIEGGYTIFLETNGSKFLGPLPKSNAIKVSMDVKCPSSGEDQKMNFTNFELLAEGDQIKFIIKDQTDYEYAKNTIKKYPISTDCSIIFSPCDMFKENNAEDLMNIQVLTEQILNDGIKVRVLPQLHKIIWPSKNHGV